MPEEPLPERLRELADDLAAHGADDPQPRAETCAALTGAADELERLARDVADAERGRDYYAGRLGDELATLGRELVSSAGVPAPMPQPRRFAAYYAAAWPLPAPGSFVQTPPAGAVWRVLSVDEGPGPVYVDRDGGERRPSVLVLEAVDPHDVPAGARADMVPLPVQELGPEGGES